MEVEFYETSDGRCPVGEFMEILDKGMKARALWMIALLQEKGNKLCPPYSKALEDGIFELRVKAGNDISRLLYFFCIGNKAVITNGFIKKTQKTPRNEIEKAKKYRKDYLRRISYEVR